MKHLDLFSGIGGFALAASWVWGEEHDIHSFVEIDHFCQKVLKKHWPETPIHDDIKTYKHDGTAIDLLTGGFPCQPYSISNQGSKRGKRHGSYLWPQMYRVCGEVGPRFIVCENVGGFINVDVDSVISDLGYLGYKTEQFIIPACAVGAIHKRERCFIIAHTRCQRLQECRDEWEQAILHSTPPIQWPSKPPVCGTDDGIPNRVDRIRALGNAIVPQVVVPIMQAIKELS